MSNLVEIRGLTKSYPKQRTRLEVLKGIDLEIGQGEIVGLLGENGSGKTTLVKTAAGIVPRDAGRVSIDGLDPEARPREVARRIGAVFPGGRNVYWRLSPRENLHYFARLRGVSLDDAAIGRLLDSFDLGGVRDTELRKLSTGMKQRVAVACGFVHRPRILFLDEPTIGLDATSTTTLTRRLEALARTDGVGILVTSHDSAFVERVCDRVLVLRNGVIQFQGSVEALRHHLRDRRSYGLQIGEVNEALAAALRERGALPPDAEAPDDFLFHRPDGSFLAEVIPVIERHGGSLRDVTMRQRPLGELMDDFRNA